MRVAFFTDTYEPQINGVVKSIKLTADELSKNGNEVFIFCPNDKKFKKQKNVFAIESISFSNYPEYRIGLPSFEVVNKVLEIKPDIIHIHSPASIGSVGLAIGKIFDIPVVITYHTLLSEYYSYISEENKYKDVIDDFTKWFFRKSFVLIVPSKSIKQMLRKMGVNKNIIVLPNPVDLKVFRYTKRKSNKIPLILHVGRLCKEKRIDFLLESFKEFLEKRNAKFIITSDGPERKHLENLAKHLGISKNVKFTGYLSNSALAKIYSKADVFVSASDTETQGIVLLEAFASGCPVLVRNALGFKDFVKDGKNGYLFDTKDEFFNKLNKLLDNKNIRNKFSKEGLKILDNFIASNIIKKLDKIYSNAYNNYNKMKLSTKIVYASALIIGFAESWFIRHLKLPLNQRFFFLYSKLIRLSMKIAKYYDYF